MAFKVGDIVKWSSQAGGFHEEKAGSVVAVIPAGVDPRRFVMEAKEKHGAKDNWGRGMARKHESYVVLVPASGKSARAKPTIYVPVASGLRAA